MMEMRLTPISIHPALQGYIEKMWIFESSGRVSADDMKLIVPNGLIKLVIPFQNGLSGSMEGWSHVSNESKMTLIGMCDKPSVVEAQHDRPAGTIGVEFSPIGAHRFFSLKQSEITNTIYDLTDVLGKIAGEVEQRIRDARSLSQKVSVLQDFLFQQFDLANDDSIFSHCVRRIQSTHGGITIKELECETGYSSRWLNMKFGEKLGISPKNFCAITRFQYCYKVLAANTMTGVHNDRFKLLYYDQSHFIKEFKRFTGLSPAKFEDTTNEFGKIFYR